MAALPRRAPLAILVALGSTVAAAAPASGEGCASRSCAAEATTRGSMLLQSASIVGQRDLSAFAELSENAITCDEASWPDKDHGLVCGECKVLVNRFSNHYRTCSGYCRTVGRTCVGAWEEEGDTCRELHTMTCEQTLVSSDAICQCGAELPQGDTCYGELAALARDEGNEVGRVWTRDVDKCKSECSADSRCQSVSFCPQWTGCWLKDRSLVGTEPTREKGRCKTFYKKPCGTAAPAPTRSPVPSPSPAPMPSPTPAPLGGGPQTLKVMSYNTQYSGYPSRVSQFGAKIAEVGAAVVGTQECQDKKALARASGYSLVPDTDFQNPIFYDPGQVSLVPGTSGWKKLPRDNYASRTLTWARFKFAGSGASFWFFNTHLPHNHGMAASVYTHSKIANILLDKRRDLGAADSPTVVVGDMNPFASNGASASFESTLRDAGFKKSYQGRGNPGFGGLDKIFASEHWTSSNGADHGTGSSDHPAIAADLTLVAPTS